MKKHLITLITLTFTLAATAQVPSYVPTIGLVGWWPFNGNANDESGNGNNGTVNGATLTADRFGAANNAYAFNGSSNFISVSPSVSNSTVVNEITLSGWIFSNDGNAFMVSKTNPSIGDYRIIQSSNYAGLLVNGIEYVFTSVSFPTNQWYHIAIIKNSNSQAFVYVNGIPFVNSSINTYPPRDPSTNIEFGKDPMGLTEFHNGKLDDIGIWNRALTSCEIQDLYHAELNSLAVSGGLDQTLCEGQSLTLTGSGANTYSWSNNVNNGVAFVPTASTNYIVTGTDANGCLGADTVTVVVNANTSSSQTQTALDSYTWPVNGQTYTQSGTYSDTLVNASGCDSIVTLNLTMSYTGIEELNPSSPKKLLRITDLSGKETPFRKNTLLLFIYEDGTVERVYVTD